MQHNVKTKHSLKIVLQWIPAHNNVKESEKAFLLAKTSSSIDQPDKPISIKYSQRNNYVFWEIGVTG